MKENIDLLHLIANTLIEEETITNEQIMNLMEHGTIHPKEEVEKDSIADNEIEKL